MAPKTHERWVANVIQYGVKVASVTAHSRDDVRREIGHYAMQYAQDGPCEVVVRCDKRVIDRIGYAAVAKPLIRR